MADQSEIDALILLVGGASDISEADLNIILDSNGGDQNLAAAQVWEIRAAKYHGLVNMSESGSSRSLGDMHKNALGMAGYFRGKFSDAVEDPGDVIPRTRIGRIVRT